MSRRALLIVGGLAALAALAFVADNWRVWQAEACAREANARAQAAYDRMIVCANKTLSSLDDPTPVEECR